MSERQMTTLESVIADNEAAEARDAARFDADRKRWPAAAGNLRTVYRLCRALETLRDECDREHAARGREPDCPICLALNEADAALRQAESGASA